MSVTLRRVLSEFNFENPDQQIAIAKLLAYRGCVPDSFSKNQLINKENAIRLLDKSFSDLVEGVEWLVKVTQESWLRKGFHKEGIGADKDPVVNAQRWMKSESNPAEAAVDEDKKLLKIFKVLGLMDRVSFRQMFTDKPYYVAIHGCVEEHAAERINFIEEETRVVYYLTNPRGLFNDEPSLAPILASWFNRRFDVNVIQQVLDQHKDMRKSDKNWLKNLSGLKAEILQALGEKEWPHGKGWYDKNPEPFDQAAKAEKRESLAGWPTATDMVEYLLKQKQEKNPGKFQQIELLPVYSVRAGRVANTEDTITDWYNLYGKDLLKHHDVYFVSNNSKGLHYIQFQDAVLQEALEKLKHDRRCITVGPGADQISLSAATDVLAKIFYTKKPRILENIAKYIAHLESNKKLNAEVYKKAILRDFSLIEFINSRFNVLTLFEKEQFLRRLTGLLAENNEHEAVIFLNRYFDVDGAIEKYIQNKNFEMVDQLLGNNHHNKREAIFNFAREGMLDKVYSKIGDDISCISAALKGFACGGRFDELNKLYQLIPSENHKIEIFAGLIQGGHFTKSAVSLKVLAQIDDVILRQSLWGLARCPISEKTLQLAERINKLMRQQGMKYEDALSSERNSGVELSSNVKGQSRKSIPGLFKKQDHRSEDHKQGETNSYSPIM